MLLIDSKFKLYIINWYIMLTQRWWICCHRCKQNKEEFNILVWCCTIKFQAIIQPFGVLCNHTNGERASSALIRCWHSVNELRQMASRKSSSDKVFIKSYSATVYWPVHLYKK